MATMEELFPEYGLRGFNTKGVHRNGTEYDDEGYDLFFKDKDGNIRPDKIPPIDGGYLRELLRAVSRALGIAEDLCSREWAWNDEMGYDEFGFLEVQNAPFLLEDYIHSLSVKSMEESDPWDSSPNYVSYGKLSICADSMGTYSISRPWGGYESFCEMTIWDERSGKVFVDTHDLPKALGQIGKQIIESLIDNRGGFFPSLEIVLVVAAEMLMIEDFWRWWQERAEPLIEEQRKEREKARSFAGRDDAGKEEDSSPIHRRDEDIPF